MKAGFKPKEFTKKEWQSNRIRKCNGSGVGKALDNFNKKCSFTLRDMTRKDSLEAMKTVNALKAALDVAKKKCDKTDVNMIKGIDAYHHVLNNYKKALAMTNLALAKRENYQKELKAEKIMTDSVFLKYLTADSKRARYADELAAYVMGKKNKLADAVRKFGKGNDYNIPGSLNQALMKIYIDGVPQAELANDKKLKKYAKKDLKSAFDMTMHKMMNGSVSSFKDTDGFKQLLEVKFPILNFSY